MENEIQELANIFFKETRVYLTQESCYFLAKIAIESGYKHKKCFNKDHSNMADVTLRDYFAINAPQEEITGAWQSFNDKTQYKYINYSYVEKISIIRYQYADAMMKQREIIANAERKE